jgi:hypothetical protein
MVFDAEGSSLCSLLERSLHLTLNLHLHFV